MASEPAAEPAGERVEGAIIAALTVAMAAVYSGQLRVRVRALVPQVADAVLVVVMA